MDEGLTRARQEREEETRRTARRRGRIIMVALALLLGFTAYTGLRQLRGSASDAAGAAGIADYRARETGERRPMPSFSYAAQAFEDEFGVTYPSAFDPSGSLAAKFQVLAIPTTFVISKAGWIEHQYMGIVSEKVLRDLIEEQLGRTG